MSAVTYVDLGLHSVSDYWNQIIVPAVQSFAELSPRTMIDVARSIWHLHDWVWHERNPGENASGAKFDAYRQDLLSRCPELAYLRDIADAGKHRGLGRRSVQVTGHRLEISPVFGVSGTPDQVGLRVVLDDGRSLDLRALVFRSTLFWKTELGYESTPPPEAVILCLNSQRTDDDIIAEQALRDVVEQFPHAVHSVVAPAESSGPSLVRDGHQMMRGLTAILAFTTRVRKSQRLLTDLKVRVGVLPPKMAWDFTLRLRRVSLHELEQLATRAAGAPTVKELLALLAGKVGAEDTDVDAASD